jgi:hypothetical protein
MQHDGSAAWGNSDFQPVRVVAWLDRQFERPIQ